jgi:hypothetical protein
MDSRGQFADKKFLSEASLILAFAGTRAYFVDTVKAPRARPPCKGARKLFYRKELQLCLNA